MIETAAPSVRVAKTVPPVRRTVAMLSEELIVSVSGIRGVDGLGLTAEAALRFAQALATATQGDPLVLSRDGRPSGVLMRHAVLAGLLGCRADVHDLGVAPTPTVGL